MKLLIFASALALLPASGRPQSHPPEAAKLYTIKSGKIVFKFVKGPQSGEKTVIFDDWGRQEKEDVTTITDTAKMRSSISGAPAPLQDIEFGPIQHQLLIKDSGEIYTINLDKKIGDKKKGVSLTLDLSSFGQTEVGKDTILGKPCRVVVVQDAFRIWYWGKIALKKELAQKVDGMRVGEYAIEIDENYRIRPDEFKVPASINMQ